MTNSLLPHAVDAVRRGWAVFPVEPGGKLPHRIRPDRDWKVRWSEVATRDLSVIAQWWRLSPQANVGIACRPSGLLVVDCDMPKVPNGLAGGPYERLHQEFGPWLHGEDVLREMCQRYGGSWDQLMDTYRVSTGSGGLHAYFRWPEGVQASQGSPVPGFVDVRCNGGTGGGYVLGAGSVTEKGPYSVERDVPVRDAPAWLVELVRDRPELRQPRVSVFAQPRGAGSFGGLVDAVQYAAEGTRNQTALWAACRMAADGASREEAESVLVPAGELCGLSAGEMLTVIRNAYRITGS